MDDFQLNLDENSVTYDLTNLFTTPDSIPRQTKMGEIMAEPTVQAPSASENQEHSKVLGSSYVSRNHQLQSSNLSVQTSNAASHLGRGQWPVISPIGRNRLLEAPSASSEDEEYYRAFGSSSVFYFKPMSSYPGFSPQYVPVPQINISAEHSNMVHHARGLQQLLDVTDPILGSPSLEAPASLSSSSSLGNQVHNRVFGSSVVSPYQQREEVQGDHIRQAREEAKARYAAKKQRRDTLQRSRISSMARRSSDVRRGVLELKAENTHQVVDLRNLPTESPRTEQTPQTEESS